MVDNISSHHDVPSRNDFPSDVLKWMKAKANPKMALKLMKCHKYFQHQQFPYCIVKKIEYSGRSNWIEWDYDNLNCQRHHYAGNESMKTIEKNFWVINYICLSNGNITPNFIQHLIPKIAVCDARSVRIECHNLLYDQLKFLIGNAEHLLLFCTTVTHENGEIVCIDTIFKCAPKLKFFSNLYSTSPIFSTVFGFNFKNIDALKMQHINLDKISYQSFKMFSKFMKHNPHIDYHLKFASLSKEETELLRNYVQRIIDIGPTGYPSPLISFDGQTKKQFHDLYYL